MSAEMAIFFGLIILFILLFSGFYVHSILMIVGVVGVVMLGDAGILVAFLGRLPFREVSTYSLSTIPLFVLMAQFILRAGIIEDLFSMVYNISKGRRGPLGILTLVVGAALGAVSGSGTATAASLGQVAVPQLTKHGYDGNLAGAVSATAGSLSGIIPPTVILILFGTMTETPIGTLFMAGIVPGLILTLCYIICTLAYLSLDKAGALRTEAFTVKRIPMSKVIIAIAVSIIIVIVVFGGIYSGFMTPTEAGAVGAFTAFISAIALGKINKSFIWDSLRETSKITVMVMLIIISAKIFSRFVSLSMLPRKLIMLLEPLLEYPGLILAILIGVYFILFMFLEGSAVIVMTTPILLPIINTMQIDVVWFGAFVGVAAVIGLVTPPVGMSVYAVCGITQLKLENVFKKTLVFAGVAGIITGGFMIAFPQIVLYLPNQMM